MRTRTLDTFSSGQFAHDIVLNRVHGRTTAIGRGDADFHTGIVDVDFPCDTGSTMLMTGIWGRDLFRIQGPDRW